MRNLLAAAVFVEQVSHDIITVKLRNSKTLPWAGGSTPPQCEDTPPGKNTKGNETEATAW